MTRETEKHLIFRRGIKVSERRTIGFTMTTFHQMMTTINLVASVLHDDNHSSA